MRFPVQLTVSSALQALLNAYKLVNFFEQIIASDYDNNGKNYDDADDDDDDDDLPCCHLFLPDGSGLSGGLKHVGVGDEVRPMRTEIFLHERKHHLNGYTQSMASADRHHK